MNNNYSLSEKIPVYLFGMKNKVKTKLLLLQTSSLFIGGLIYVLFRSYSLTMFIWFDVLGLSNIIESARNISLQYSGTLPSWVLYSLPDGLWIFSYVCLTTLIWFDSSIKKLLTWVLIIPIVAILSEVGQLSTFIPGTFDIIDILFYLLGTVLPLLIYFFLTIKNSNYEK